MTALATGHLRMADGDQIHYEVSGNRLGRPALYLHGGPGSGLGHGGYRRLFDPAAYHVIAIDQRGCGRSRPLATAALERLHRNTTQTLIADIEAVRRHVGVESWLVSGVSWGSTLALAYAQTHPHRVTELVLAAVTTTSPEEVEWITEGVGRIFPEAWQVFERGSRRIDGERIVDAYARRLAGADAEDRVRAASDWVAWEAAHIAFDSGGKSPPIPDEGPEHHAVFATLVTHYWAHDGFLPAGQAILDRMDAIRHIPAVLIHGRRDVSGPPVTAWRLHRQWPASRLVVVETEGHGGPEMTARMREATDAFAADPTAARPASACPRPGAG
ncbi:prolyl aminopeptidase [Methylobacterium oryzihabitans]|uniref:Proline iminopeptidase n=1 Tax=Methylobacterium oryzihabitans TaxID=2499852 RepID=A0A3S2V642_9HYPH|nr:prolyl aminopeptidase [Methylobacterium oryzihabitans]RVU14547.1 prolyl aminopeptidase [Methylobacterium oryzihabitans]